MGNPEEIPNIEPFPVSARFRRAEGVPVDPASPAKGGPTHTLTPLHRAKVEFWHQGEQASPIEQPVPDRRYNHARRADQMGLLMLFLAALVIFLVTVALYLNNKKYSFAAGSAKRTTAPVIDFYQGNQAFTRKVNQEKSGSVTPDLPVQGANEDFEISLQAQMASMNEKLEKMRSQKLMEEPPIPVPDKGTRPVPVTGVRPADVQKFDSPMEFNGMLPKPLRETK